MIRLLYTLTERKSYFFFQHCEDKKNHETSVSTDVKGSVINNNNKKKILKSVKISRYSFISFSSEQKKKKRKLKKEPLSVLSFSF